MQWIDGSLGNLLQCQSLDVPQTVRGPGVSNWGGGGRRYSLKVT